MLRLLSDAQVLSYDYASRGGYETCARGHGDHVPTLLRQFGSLGPGDWRFLDLGGGIGPVSDFILRHFPNASSVLIDSSRAAIEANASDPRKTCICGSVDHLAGHFQPASFDLVLTHDFLHHLVTGNYAESGRAVDNVLRQAKWLLRPGGRLSIMEQCYDGWIDAWPSHIIFQATSSRLLAGIARRFGSQSAGVGVRFQSLRRWRRTLARDDIVADEVTVTQTFSRRRVHDLLSGLKVGRVVHFWCH